MDLEDEYPAPEDKLALSIASAKVAKAEAVAEQGIGEMITYTMIGWYGARIKVITQLDGEVYLEDTQRFNSLAKAAFLLRRGFACTALTLVAEGFCVTREPDAHDEPLAVRFARGDADVSECLSFLHVEDDGGQIVASQPYSYSLGRKVHFESPVLLFSLSPGSGGLANAFHRALSLRPDIEQDDEALVRALGELHLSSLVLET